MSGAVAGPGDRSEGQVGHPHGRDDGRSADRADEERDRVSAPPEGLCLVTGASGFVGSHLVERLIDRGYRVRVLVRRSSKLRWVRGLPVELAYGDIRDKASVAGACVGVQNAFHFGALTTAKNESEFSAANEGGTRNLAEALAERGEPNGFIVHCSSLAAGGPSIATASQRQPVRIESEPDLPITPYGRSKLASERALFAIEKERGRFRAVALRPAAVYGPRDTAILEFFRLVKMGFLLLSGPEGARFSMVYVSDLVEAALGAAESDVRGHYYVTDGEVHSWEEVGRLAGDLMDSSAREIRLPVPLSMAVAWAREALGRITGRPPTVTRWKVREIQQPHWVCSAERARKDFGFVPQVSLEDGLEQTLSWYREIGWL